MFRQGDVLLKPVKDLPRTATQEKGPCVLAHGEATGHTHHIKDGAEIWVDVNDHGRRYLKVLAETTLDHEEHGRIALTRGTYEIVRQREYTPTALRFVED